MAAKFYKVLEVMEHDLGQPGASFELVAGQVYALEETVGDALIAGGKAQAAEKPKAEPAPEA